MPLALGLGLGCCSPVVFQNPPGAVSPMGKEGRYVETFSLSAGHGNVGFDLLRCRLQCISRTVSWARPLIGAGLVAPSVLLLRRRFVLLALFCGYGQSPRPELLALLCV